jgi:DNA-binding transcriptional LysR family regulator
MLTAPQYPAVRIHLHEGTSRQQLDALESGRIDVGFTRPLPKTQSGHIVLERVYRDSVFAVLSDRHALAGLRKISLQKLANEDWVLLSRSTAPEVVDGFTLLCTNAGFSPRAISEPARMQTVLTMVAARVGVSLAAGCDSRLNQPGVRFIPIQPDPPPFDLVAARPDGEPPPTVAAFLEILRQQLPQIRSKYAYLKRTISGRVKNGM